MGKIWPWPKVKVIDTWVIECALLGCTLVPSMKSIDEIAPEIWPVLCFLCIFGKIWPWPLTLTKGQGHRHLGHWMHLIVLYLGTKYEVCKWNSLKDMTSSLFFLPIFGKILPWPLTLTFSQGHRHLSHWMRLIGLYLDTKYEVCRWNSLWDMTSSLFFYPFLRKFDLDLWHLGHWMRLIGLYLGTKYEVCRWNSL